MPKKNTEKLRTEVISTKQVPLLISRKEKIYLRSGENGWFIYRLYRSRVSFFYPQGIQNKANQKIKDNSIWSPIDRYLTTHPFRAIMALSTGLRSIENEPEKSDFIDSREDFYATCLSWLRLEEPPQESTKTQEETNLGDEPQQKEFNESNDTEGEKP